jgi:hypothetical protein
MHGGKPPRITGIDPYAGAGGLPEPQRRAPHRVAAGMAG